MSRPLPPILEVPDEPRRLRLHRSQWVGLPLMFLVPVLALSGVFGETRAQVDGAGADVALSVHYATRYRYKEINTVEVRIENRSGSLLDTVVVAFDGHYIRRFSEVTFTPSPEEPFEVELVGLERGDARLVWVELQGEEYGRHTGEVRAFIPGRTDTVTVRLSTFIFP